MYKEFMAGSAGVFLCNFFSKISPLQVKIPRTYGFIVAFVYCSHYKSCLTEKIQQLMISLRQVFNDPIALLKGELTRDLRYGHLHVKQQVFDSDPLINVLFSSD